jgi:TfoX N-terminal domain
LRSKTTCRHVDENLIRREHAGVDESAPYRRVVEALLADGGVSEGQMMGMPALKVGGKMFSGCFEGRLVVKIGRARVAELIAAGCARPFDPSGRDRPMKDWAQLLERDRDWLALAREARTSSQPAVE